MTARLTLPECRAADNAAYGPEEQQEYEAVRDAFRRLVKWWENSAERKDLIEEIITLRASFLIDRALRGLRIDFDRALDILRNRNAFISARERQQHEILVAAVENLIDFAVAEEMTMLGALPEHVSETNLAECEEVCRRYNLVYAQKENEQVGLAAAMAAWWMAVSENTLVTFMTQGDERVRPWHLSFEWDS